MDSHQAEHSLVLAFVGIVGEHLASVDSSVRAVDVPFGIEVGFVVDRRVQLDYLHVAGVVDRRIVMVICTFASDLGHDREYFDTIADMDREHRDRLAFPFEEAAFEEGDKVAEDSVGDQEEELLAVAAAVVVHLNFRPMTLN